MRNAVRQVRNASKLGCCDIVGGAQHSAPGCMLRAILCPIRSIGSIALHSCPSKAGQLQLTLMPDGEAAHTSKGLMARAVSPVTSTKLAGSRM